MSTSTARAGASELSVARASHRARIVAGISDSFSAGLGIFPFGIALGLLVVQLGLPWWVAPALSLSAFAGSLELLVVGMIASAAPLAAVAITVFVVNFRHVFYAFCFPRHLIRNRFARLYATYAMIDEVYAVNAALPKSHQSAARIVSMQAACQIYWVAGGLVGVMIARLLPGPIKGLEFALCALFTVLTLDAFRSRREVPPVLLAGASIGIALLVAPGIALFVAMLIFVGLLLARYAIHRRHAGKSTNA
jgi:4-azaleucine resistance transporter AzlC